MGILFPTACLVCWEQHQELTGQLSLPSTAGAAAPVLRSPAGALFFPAPCPGAAVRHRQGEGKLINQPRAGEGASDSVRPKRGSSHCWKGHFRRLLVVSTGQRAEIPGKTPISVDLFVNHSYCQISEVFCSLSCLLQQIFKADNS